jgi:hypothetical protein
VKGYVTIDGRYHKLARSYIGAVKMAFRLSSEHPSSKVRVVVIPESEISRMKREPEALRIERTKKAMYKFLTKTK